LRTGAGDAFGQRRSPRRLVAIRADVIASLDRPAARRAEDGLRFHGSRSSSSIARAIAIAIVFALKLSSRGADAAQPAEDSEKYFGERRLTRQA
jgi:hypothetical protein